MLLAGHVLIALGFLGSAANTLMQFADQGRLLAGRGIPIAGILLAALVGLELTGGLAVLVGFRTRGGAAMLALSVLGRLAMFGTGANDLPDGPGGTWGLVPSLAMLGATLLITSHGGGPWAMDEIGK